MWHSWTCVSSLRTTVTRCTADHPPVITSFSEKKDWKGSRIAASPTPWTRAGRRGSEGLKDGVGETPVFSEGHDDEIAARTDDLHTTCDRQRKTATNIRALWSWSFLHNVERPSARQMLRLYAEDVSRPATL